MAIGRSSLSWGVLAPVGVEPIVPGGASSPPPAPVVPPLTPPAPAPAPNGNGGNGQPFAVFDNQAALEDRLARAQRAGFREQFGTDDPAEVRSRLERLKKLEDEEAERQRAQLSDQQRLQADLDAEKAKRAAAEAERDQVKFESIVARSCAGHGIKNVAYAQFTVAQAAEALPDGQQIDVDKYLQELLSKQEYRGAFGIAAAVTETQPAPVTTSPNPGTPPPPPPAPGGGTAPGVDAMTMKPEDFRAHLAKLGVP